MAIYTKKGDRGKTSLYGGERRGKDDQRVVAYGSVDELSSHLGVVISLLAPKLLEVEAVILQIQEDLFEMASELAGAPKLSFGSNKVKYLEKVIDNQEGKLPVLANFIFPGGSKPGAFTHVVRSVCRRAEREIVALSKKEKVNPNILVYINRLSDCLFMLARQINLSEGEKEEIWKKK